MSVCVWVIREVRDMRDWMGGAAETVKQRETQGKCEVEEAKRSD